MTHTKTTPALIHDLCPTFVHKGYTCLKDLHPQNPINTIYWNYVGPDSSLPNKRKNERRYVGSSLTATSVPSKVQTHLVLLYSNQEKAKTLLYNFLSNCPLLEELTLYNCNFKNHNVVTISSPILKILNFSTFTFNGEIKVSSRCLRKIDYQSNPLCICFEDTTTLYDISFSSTLRPNGSDEMVRDVIDHCVSKIIFGLCSMVKLALRGTYVEFLTREHGILARLPTSSCSMQHLQLDMFPARKEAQTMTFLLRGYPNLRTLCICIKRWPDIGGKNVRRYWLAENISSDGILKNLRKVQIKYFEGSDIELELVKYLLKNASILEKADIFVSVIKQTYEKEHISMKVHTFARASPCVEISVF